MNGSKYSKREEKKKIYREANTLLPIKKLDIGRKNKLAM
jgi:hypothetical protein